MHYWGYVIEQLIDGGQRQKAEARRAEVRRSRNSAGSDRRWSRTAPRE